MLGRISSYGVKTAWMLAILGAATWTELAKAQGLEDVGAIFYDASESYSWFRWSYDERAETKPELETQMGRGAGLSFGVRSGVQVTKGCCPNSAHPMSKAEQISKVVDRSACEVSAGVYPRMDAESLDAMEKEARQNWGHPPAVARVRPTRAEFERIAPQVYKERRFYLNRVIPGDITRKVDFTGGEVSYEFTLKGVEEVYCETTVVFDERLEKQTRRSCSKELVLNVSQQNLKRFEQVIAVTFSKLCTGAKRPAGRF